MQDKRYDELRQMLGANAEKGIDERIKELVQNPTEPRWDDLEKEIGRVCGKSGEHHDLTGYRISYMYRDGRHIVEPPYNKEPQVERLREWEDAPQKRLSREDYERFGRHTNYTPPSPVNKKKRKAKAKAQKQSRRKNRKH